MLWRPDPSRETALSRFFARLPAEVTADWTSYADLWHWSITDLDGFWRAVWDFYQIRSTVTPHDVLEVRTMPGATWFPGTTVNYAEHMLRCPGRGDDDLVVLGRSQTRPHADMTLGQLRSLVGRLQEGLRGCGVGPGDRVVAYAPNIPETLALLLACAGLGAVFSSCPPEFGSQGVLDRWRQVDPTVLVAVDGYVYGRKRIDRRAEVAEIVDGLPSLRHVVGLPYLDPDRMVHSRAFDWTALVATPATPTYEPVPFDHPLWILFSSGTTGLPKAIVHGHGGITLEHLKALGLQADLGPTSRFFWFTTTGWMMWNFLVSGLAVGSTVVLFDGDPGHPDLGRTWRLAAETEVTHFGTSAPFLQQCEKQGVVPRELADLSSVVWVGSTGAPLPATSFDWVYEQFGRRVHLSSMSGGTDVCSAFIGSSWCLPVVRGALSGRALGASVKAYDALGRSVVEEVGELVIDQPMPSMPLTFWGEGGAERYRQAYFGEYPGVWRHGDWITISTDGTCVLSGRSDATLNRGGVRLGTAEFYAVVESFPFVTDSLVVHLDDADVLALFVVGTDGKLDDEQCQQLRSALRGQLSPRHVPDMIIAIDEVPRTLSGKKLEVPVKRILGGAVVADVVAPGSLATPESLAVFVDLAHELGKATVGQRSR